MTGRERVLAAIEHNEPDRVPIDMGSYPGGSSINVQAYENFLQYLGINRKVNVAHDLLFTADVDDDILERFNIDTKSIKPSVEKSEFDSPESFMWEPFKIKWQRASDFTYAPVEGPFQKITEPDISVLEKFKWPEPKDLADSENWRKKVSMIRGETKNALVARMPTAPFCTAQWLRGFEGWCMDFFINPSFSEALHDKLVCLWIDTMDILIDVIKDNVDIWIIGEDLGLQDQLMVSPELFREKMKPYMKRMIGFVKSKSSGKVALHSCGSIYDLIFDFIDIGFDILNPLQATARNMDPKKVKQRAGKDIALWGGIDSHNVLTKGSREEIFEEVKRKIEILGKGGGYIFSADHNILVDVPPENICAMFEAAIEYGKY